MLMTLTEAQVAEVRHLATRSRVEALVLLRAITGCSLRDAIDALATLAPVPDAPAPQPTAELYAFGEFSPAVADLLDYPAEYYAGVQSGTPVSVLVSEAFGMAAIARLAGCLGVEVADMNQWAVDAAQIDVGALAAAELADAERVEGLRAAGFSFHFAIDPSAG